MYIYLFSSLLYIFYNLYIPPYPKNLIYNLLLKKSIRNSSIINTVYI